MKKRTKKQIGKLSRTKGHSFEREIAKRLREIFPEAKRHLEYQSQEAEKGQDIDNTHPYCIQCKRGRKYANPNKIEEVQTVEDEIPVLITKGDGKKEIVCMYLDDWMELQVNLKRLRTNYFIKDNR